jgi:23S rRNA (adenine2503-C2)-methyltransferase
MVVACRVLAADAAADASITNVVFMGMGEPLHNYDAVMAAVDIMCQPLGLHMSHNKVRPHGCVTAAWQLLTVI